ncbi:MAG TPA: DoxX family membrane protein [Gammaproteobacteria bacterium]|nr:DoxX family membrane protein [Gammaproteobacteria bacterium]
MFNPYSFRGTLPGWPLALLRMAIGAMFIKAGAGKVAAGEGFAARLPDFFARHAAETFDFYRPFVEAVVLPHAGVFAALVAWGELALGLALVFGALTRLASFFGLVMVLNFWFAKGEAFWSAGNHDSLCILIFGVLMFTAAGRVFGLDAWLARRWPNRWLW